MFNINAFRSHLRETAESDKHEFPVSLGDNGYHKGYSLHISEIGFTDATDPAVVSSFRT